MIPTMRTIRYLARQLPTRCCISRPGAAFASRYHARILASVLFFCPVVERRVYDGSVSAMLPSHGTLSTLRAAAEPRDSPTETTETTAP